MMRLPLKITKPLLGDVLVLLLGLVFVGVLFSTLWNHAPAAKVQIRLADKIYATYSLDQNRTIEIKGPIGITRILIDHGKARFASSPCPNQYCVHQGWLNHMGQAAICLPNQISLELLGGEKPFDSLNY